MRFASDNSAGVHPEILAAIAAANVGHALAYGADPWTARAVDAFRTPLRPGRRVVFFVFNGTGANVLGSSRLTQPYEAVICADYAHINVDECGAPERFTGCKLIGVPAPDGRLTPDAVARVLHGIGNPASRPAARRLHHAVERVWHRLHGGRNRAPSPILPMRTTCCCTWMARESPMLPRHSMCRSARFTLDAGVDVLSFGGTKNGLLGAEAVVLFDPARAAIFRFIRKQGMQLASKMRFVAAQFEALLGTDLWLRSAGHANAMARRLGDGLRGVPGVTVTHPVEANGVFAILPRDAIAPLQEEMFFYVWDEGRNEVRLMASFDTTPDDVDRFVAAVARRLAARA